MLRFGLAVGTLLVATAVAVAGALVVLPPFGGIEPMLHTAVTEFSLNLLLPILLALVLAAFSGWSGMPRVGLVAAILAGVAIPLALVPAVRGGIEAHDRGIGIDPWEYVSGTGLDIANRSDETRAYGPAAEQPDNSGRELVVWRPDEDPGGLAPAVIHVHDGGGFDRWNAWFTERGMLSFELVTDRPGEVKCALGWLHANAAEFGVDLDRIVLFGTGAGGRVAMLAAYGDDTEVPSACPPPEPTPPEPTPTGPEPTGPNPTDPANPTPRSAGSAPREPAPPRIAAVLVLYPPSEHPDRAEEPFRYLDPNDPPTLVAHGGRDSVVPITESRRTAAELEVAGVPGRLVEIDYAGHGFDLNWGGFANQITRAEIERFLRQVPSLR